MVIRTDATDAARLTPVRLQSRSVEDVRENRAAQLMRLSPTVVWGKEHID